VSVGIEKSAAKVSQGGHYDSPGPGRKWPSQPFQLQHAISQRRLEHNR
jgi:hypothetical protein